MRVHMIACIIGSVRFLGGGYGYYKYFTIEL